ncbi:MAG TPA: PEP-CTERM system TPR-repeat protein PrsT, partial [Rhodocyclaceae bacterium]|nr:PEP-CTERM system TPR-repeat protein PrsT [Rhodocyclaceae bacterium]
YLRRSEFDKALKAIDVLAKKQPDSPLAPSLRGQALLAKKDVAGARKNFEQALKVSPVYFPAAAILARLDMAEKKPDDARKRFESVLAADPKNTPALLAIAELKAATGGTPDEVIALVKKAVQANPTDVTPRQRLIDLYLRSKDTKQAVSAAQDAVAAIPDNAGLLDAQGRAQQAAGDTQQAISTYNRIVALQPNSPLGHLRIAAIHAMAKNPDAALQSLQRALEIKPDLLDAQRGLITLYLEGNRLQEALAVAKKVQKQRPTEAIGYVFEGDIYASRKSWAEAIAAFRAGLKALPASGELAVKLSNALRANQQSDEAEKFVGSWFKQYPKDPAFLFYMGDLAIARKEYDKAAGYYRTVVDAQPNNAMALNNLAWATGQSKGAKAIEYAEMANRLAPNQPAFMDTLAVLLAEKGDHVHARQLLEQALKLQPQAAPIRLNLAKVLIKAGDKGAARKELDELAKLGDKFAGQAEVAQLLKSL